MSELLEKDAVDILVEAKLYVEKGWCQGSFGRVENPNVVEGFIGVASPKRATQVCALGAITKASDATTWAVYSQSASEAAALLGESVLGEDYSNPAVDGATGVAQWNDAPGRTQDEVVEGFEKAIALAVERS